MRMHRRVSIVRVVARTITIAVACVSVALGASNGTAHAAREISIDRPGPLGAVTVIGDSVLLGAGLYSPTLPDQLASRGWGPIRFRAAGSATSGRFPVANEFRSSFWIDLWQSQGWDPKHVIVNLGVNDSGFCGTDIGCAYASIMHLVDAIGPGHEIWWPTITKSSASTRDTFNAALRIVESERSDFHVWDWFSEFAAGGYRSGDQIHLDPAGYRMRSERMATVFTERFSVARRTGGDVALPSPTGPASRFAPRPPERIVDTRLDGERAVEGERFEVDLDAHLPVDATAVALYLTSARSAADGYLSTGPCDAPPSGATLNFRAGLPIGAPTISAIGGDRSVCIFASRDTDLVIDLQGAFTSSSDGLRMTPLAVPERLHDSRTSGRVQRLVLDPTAALGESIAAVAINLTAARPSTIGYLTAAGCDEAPGTASLNFLPGPPVSSSAIVELGHDGTFCVTATGDAEVIVDLTAGFGIGGDLSFVPVVPTRTLDTRVGVGGWEPVHGAGQTIDVGVAPPSAAAVTGTLTLVRPDATGFVSADACTGEAATSSVNAGGGVIAANSLTTAVSDGRLCLASSRRAQTVFDTSGWWVPS